MHPMLQKVNDETGLLTPDKTVKFTNPSDTTRLAQAATKLFESKTGVKRFNAAKLKEMAKNCFGIEFPEPKTSNPRKEYRMMFTYMTLGLIESGGDNVEQVFENAKVSAAKMFRNSPFSLIEGSETEVTMGEGETVKFIRQKPTSTYVKGSGKTGRVKGDKKNKAQEIFDAMHKKDPNVESAPLVERFMKELGMTKAGATTYAYNVRKAAGLVSGKKGRKAKAAVAK